MSSKAGMTLIELVAATALIALVTLALTRYFNQSARTNAEIAATANARSELESVADRLRRNIERHSGWANSVELTPSGTAFAPSGPVACQNLTLRQRVLGTGGNPTRTRKLEYVTLCEGEALSDAGARVDIHPDLATACTSAPRVRLRVWEDETVPNPTTTTVFPSGAQRALAICFRPDSLTNPKRISIEMGMAYTTPSRPWKTLRKSMNVTLFEMGSDIEVVSP